LLHGGEISYRQAHRLREQIINEQEGSEIDSFALIPDLLNRIEALSLKQTTDHAAEAVLSNTGEFEALAIAPGPCRSASTALRPYTGLDGTHTKSRFRMMLLIATGIDANGQILLLAWALVPTENKEWWTWFCTFLHEYFPLLR
jgi:hypothetical protein